MNSKFVIIILVVAIIFFAIGFAVSGYFKPASTAQCNPNAYQEGWDAAKQRLQETGASFEQVELGDDIRSVYGQVITVTGGKINVKIRPLEPLADPTLDNRTIIVGENTNIIKYVPKNFEQYQQEIDQWNQQGTGDEPSAYTSQELSTSDLTSHMNVVVHADHNIKNEKQFTATQIVIYEN